MSTLARARIKTEVGVLEKRARKLNEAYLKFIRTGIPFITLKLAVTLDGKIADAKGKSAWISCTETRKRFHQLRAWADAVMVGVGTVLADNPQLTVRYAEGSDPLRIIVDSTLKTPDDAHVLADNNVLMAASDLADENRIVLFKNRGIDVLKINAASQDFIAHEGKVSLSELLKKLGERNITSLLCEGGAVLATSLLKERLIDKIVFSISPKIIGKGIGAVGDIGVESIEQALELREIEIEYIEQDVLITGYPVYQG
jgi:diaminohydroxyphosphoribosylaminopyrimidine deaminase/5-amino-6-(5-phosphoribosylamino)uracil reductase